MITESSAIQLCLAEKHREAGFIPDATEARAQMYRWIFFLVTEIVCWKARAWFAIVQQEDLKLLSGEKEMGRYQWIPEGRKEPHLTYRFCSQCGVRIYAAGDDAALGGKFFAIHVPNLDDASNDDLAAAPLKLNDMLHNRPDRTPADTRML